MFFFFAVNTRVRTGKSIHTQRPKMSAQQANPSIFNL